MGYILTLVAFLIYLPIKRPAVKVIVATLLACLLFWWAGPVAFLFAITVTLWQCLTSRKQVLHALAPLFAVLILAYASIRLSWVSDWKQALLPIFYFHHKLTPPPLIYFPWVMLCLLVVTSFLLRNLKVSKRLQYASFIGQLIMVPLIAYWLIPTYGQRSSAEYKQMDYYVRMERWNDLIEASRKPITNFLHAYYLNIALMETDQLGKQFLRFDQKGIRGLVPTPDKGFATLIILNELNFTLGDIAASQQLAFEQPHHL